MDDNYWRLVPRRLARATGAIRLEASTATSPVALFPPDPVAEGQGWRPPQAARTA